jgi:hypothetical protein
VRAALTIQERSYSPLPWLDRYTNTITLEPAARKTLVLAVGEDRQIAAWYFVLNHRDTYSNAPMDWTNMAPIPSDLPMKIMLVDVTNGELIAEFDYLWTFDANNGWPTLKTPPDASAVKERASELLRQIHKEGAALREKILISDDSLSVETCQRELDALKERIKTCVTDYVSLNKALYADWVPTVQKQSYSGMTKSNTTKEGKAGIIGHLDARLSKLSEIIKEL